MKNHSTRVGSLPWQAASSPDGPLVTVVITTKNRPALVELAVASALRQTHSHLQVIIVDDGSIPPLQLQLSDPRVQCLRNAESTGVCAARNLGLRFATGEWVTFLDDDDELTPTMVEASLEAARNSSLARPVAVLSAMKWIDGQGRDLRTVVPPRLARGDLFFLSPTQPGTCWSAKNAIFAPQSVLVAIGGWDERLGAAEHTDFLLRLSHQCSLEGTAHVSYLYRDHDLEHLSHSLLKTAQDMELTLQKHWDVFCLNRRKMATYAASCAFFYLRGGRWGKAIRWSTVALLADLKQPRVWLKFGACLAGPAVIRLRRRLRKQVP